MAQPDVTPWNRAAPPPVPRPDFVPGLLVVRVEEDVVSGLPDIRSASRAALKRLSLPEKVNRPFRTLQRGRTLLEACPVFAKTTRGAPVPRARASLPAAFAASVRDSENEDLRGITLLRLSKRANLAQVEKELAGSPGVAYVHRVPARWAAGGRSAKPRVNDPLVNRQWGLRAIKWFNVAKLPDASAVKVAVLDTGIDTDHTDLAFSGYSHEGARAEDVVGHGTHVAGIIGARVNNKAGIAGVCQCDLWIWKIFGDRPAADGEYYVDELLYQRALNAARNQGARVLNLSIGGTVYTQTEALLIRRLIAAGCVVVAAMGNEFDQGNPVEYPAAHKGVVAVAASDEANRRARFSNTGRHVALSAPGTNILSTLPTKTSPYRGAGETEYAAWSGTSMAAPHVAAAAALVLASDPSLTPAQVADRLRKTAARVPAMKKRKWTQEYGSGLLDLEAALS